MNPDSFQSYPINCSSLIGRQEGFNFTDLLTLFATFSVLLFLLVQRHSFIQIYLHHGRPKTLPAIMLPNHIETSQWACLMFFMFVFFVHCALWWDIKGQRSLTIDQTWANLISMYCSTSDIPWPYMQKTCDVAEMAILAKKICGKSA